MYVCNVSAKLDGVKTYMRMRRVPNHLQVKVIKWFDYLWLTQKCSDEEKAVSCLPGELYNILHFHHTFIKLLCDMSISVHSHDGVSCVAKPISNSFNLVVNLYYLFIYFSGNQLYCK